MMGLGGPVITFLLYGSGMHWAVDLGVILVPIFIGYIVSIVIAVVVHLAIRNFMACLSISTGLCLLAYLLLVTLFMVDHANPEERMWLPVVLYFVCVNCFAMAFTASGSTLLLLRFKEIMNKKGII
ncbi:MAG: hypothetical protein ABFD91_17015 [Anaerohalosphaeraceae bacterium]